MSHIHIRAIFVGWWLSAVSEFSLKLGGNDSTVIRSFCHYGKVIRGGGPIVQLVFKESSQRELLFTNINV